MGKRGEQIEQVLLGKPQVVVIAPRVIGFAHAARRAPYRADAQPLAAPARTA